VGADRQPRPLRALKAARAFFAEPARAFLAEPAPRGFTLGLHAFCKVNLGLAVGPRRPDGFHDLRTVFQTVDLADSLYARLRPSGLRLRVVRRGPARRAGLPVAGGGANLVARAARLVRAAARERRGAEIVLVKRVPAGSGLGGGSSDAAAALRLFGRLWGARLSLGAERRLAGELGSDCAFFLAGGRARASGRGDRLRALPVPTLERLVLVLPRVGVPTATAYRLLDRSRAAAAARGPRPAPRRPPRNPDAKDLTATGPPRIINLDSRIQCRVGRSSFLLDNDFEEVIARHYPVVHAAREWLSELGVGKPRMSGSGSAVFAILARGARPGGVVTRLRRRSFEVVQARFTRVGSLWCR
jgi:4-diphosphocytidyl-2-C-methyl-D-erythritol kinase